MEPPTTCDASPRGAAVRSRAEAEHACVPQGPPMVGHGPPPKPPKGEKPPHHQKPPKPPKHHPGGHHRHHDKPDHPAHPHVRGGHSP